MRTEPIKVVIWGFGAMGSGMAKVLLNKSGVSIVGVCDCHEARRGREMHEILGVERGNRKPVIVEAKIEKVLTERSCDLCLIATHSFTEDAFPGITYALSKKVNVISTAEEMAYPKAKNPALAEQLDQLAKANGVSVLGTGINPGLMMDLLVVALTGCMTDVKHIEAKRVNSLSPFGKAVMEEQGVGLSEAAFQAGAENGSIAGHVGFEESIAMIAEALQMPIDQIETQKSPILTDVERRSPYGYAAAGHVAGVNMTGQGLHQGEVMIDMVHPQQIEPQLGGVHTGDYITLTGTPPVHMAITPEVDGGIGTIAMCVNMIPHVINARPGLKTMLDLPVPRAIIGDMRHYLEAEDDI
ncbi:NADP-binding protein [Fusibacter paucivorans]|uniref:NADP-binding protein n=1 Tax=Fusibacter paucivorans TaxID=76009 RepID=A0ABS5PRF6_9FIRM|nr:2,4-diaminopentanoate dehydrogenase [Fusibacter paucivorans]MBS7527743.1 NADP-binding protein [Fusibacter paucivorans]